MAAAGAGADPAAAMLPADAGGSAPPANDAKPDQPPKNTATAKAAPPPAKKAAPPPAKHPAAPPPVRTERPPPTVTNPTINKPRVQPPGADVAPVARRHESAPPAKPPVRRTPPRRVSAPPVAVNPTANKPKVVPPGANEPEPAQRPARPTIDPTSTHPTRPVTTSTGDEPDTPRLNPTANKPKIAPPGSSEPQAQPPEPEPKPQRTPEQRQRRSDARGYADTIDQIDADGGALRMGTANALERYGKDPAVVERAQRILERRRDAARHERIAYEQRQESLNSGSIETVDDPGQYELEPEGFDHQSRKNLRQLQKTYPRLGIEDVVNDGNHPTGGLKDEDKGVREVFDDDPTEDVSDAEPDTTGYSWEDSDDFSDNDVERMTPQGITGQDGIHAVSWYGQPGGDGPDDSGRVTFVDRDKKNYRHVLLVKPNGGSDYSQVDTHAGGIAWKGDHMYVADTHGGFKVFDTNQIMRVPEGNEDPASDGYRYLMPQVGSYKSTGTDMRFSTASIDDSNPANPGLVAGEYRDDGAPDTRGNTHVVRWDIDPDTGLLKKKGATEAYETKRDQVQGAAIHDGRIYLSSSDPGGDGGALYTGHPGETLEERPWGDTPESLYVEGNRLWSLSEQHHNRAVYSVPRDDD